MTSLSSVHTARGASTRSAPSPANVTLAGAYRFFLPLIFMTELNAISKSVIHAFLARLENPSATLAGFNISFTFYYATTAATEVCALLTISYLKSRQSLFHLLRFFCVLIIGPWLFAQLVAWTSVGDWIYGTLFGASDTAVEQAKLATFMLSLSAPVLMGRALAFGLLLINRRTIFITYATLCRLISLAGFLVFLPFVLDGAAVGAAALVGCMAVETVVAWILAFRYFRALPATGSAPPSMGEMWRFSWPLMLNQSAEMGVVFIINIFIGRLANPDLALAAFGVVHGLVSLLFSPGRNLLQTAQTLARTVADARVLIWFTVQLSSVFALISIVLFWTPLESWVLADVMGLKPELQRYCLFAMQLAFLMAAMWSFSALFRGLTAGTRDTRSLALTGGARLLVAVALSMTALADPTINGATIGLIAWVAGYATEVAILSFAWNRRRKRA
ncbi:MAG: hypothetical protein AAF493_11490 [Pseudomonadota bacterium]